MSPAFYLALHVWPNISLTISRSGKDFMLEAIDVLKGVGSNILIYIRLDIYRFLGSRL